MSYREFLAFYEWMAGAENLARQGQLFGDVS